MNPPFTPITVQFHPDGTPIVDHLEYDTITGAGIDYMHRHYLHRNYDQWSAQLHHIIANDPEPDPHDHPWDFTSILLTGGYRDINPTGTTEHRAPCIITRRAETPHRLELLDGPTWTLVATGPVRRKWGYHTTRGWIPWRTYRGVRS